MSLLDYFRPIEMNLPHTSITTTTTTTTFTSRQTFMSTAPLQYVPLIRFTQATIDCLTTNDTKNALHKETVILNYIGGDPISYNLSN